MSNGYIWPIDRTLSDVTTPSQSRLESDGNEGVLYIPQSSSITGALQSDCLVPYLGHVLAKEGLTLLQRCCWCILQSPAEWANDIFCTVHKYLKKKTKKKQTKNGNLFLKVKIESYAINNKFYYH